MRDELYPSYQAWRSSLQDDVNLTYAHSWYKEQYVKVEKFIAGMKDWISVAQNKLEEQVVASASELGSTTSSQRSAANYWPRQVY